MPQYDYDLDFDHYNQEDLVTLVREKKSITITDEMERQAQEIRQRIKEAFPYPSGITDSELHVAKLYESRIRFPAFYADLLSQQNGSKPSGQSIFTFFAVGATVLASAAVATYMNQLG